PEPTERRELCFVFAGPRGLGSCATASSSRQRRSPPRPQSTRQTARRSTVAYLSIRTATTPESLVRLEKCSFPLLSDGRHRARCRQTGIMACIRLSVHQRRVFAAGRGELIWPSW